MYEYINYVNNTSNVNHNFKNQNKEQIYETNELLNIIYEKWESQKIEKANYVGKKDRYIPVTNLFGCPRMLTYSRYDKFRPDINIVVKYPYVELITEVGQFIHDYLAKLLGIYDITKIYLVNDEYKVRGKCDGILYNALLEFKTVEFLPKNIEEDHLTQIRILFDLALLNGYDNIEIAKIIYIKRNLKEFKEFNIHIDKEKNKQIVQKYYEIGLYLYNCLLENKLSDKINKKSCMFCPYSTICEYSNKSTKKITEKQVNNKQENTKIENNKEGHEKDINSKEITENKHLTKSKNSEQNKTSEVEWID